MRYPMPHIGTKKTNAGFTVRPIPLRAACRIARAVIYMFGVIARCRFLGL